MKGSPSGRRMDGLPATYVLAQLRLPSMTSIAEGMLNRALIDCAEQMRLSSPEEALEFLRQGDAVARWYCHHSVGAQVAEMLGDLDDTVQQVLVFDLNASPEGLLFRDSGPASPVCLVIQVQRKTESLGDLAHGLERALAKEYASMVGRWNEGRLLQVQVIDVDDVEKRHGYVGLLGSLLNCPLRVWQRKQ